MDDGCEVSNGEMVLAAARLICEELEKTQDSAEVAKAETWLREQAVKHKMSLSRIGTVQIADMFNEFKDYAAKEILQRIMD